MLLFLKLLGAAMIPVILSGAMYLLKRNTPFGKLPRLTQQIIIGIIFGGAAIFGTEFGVDIGGATANARDAAPLCAGILFGAPAGIIAGIIGGIERWFAVAWGAGMYSRLACTISTILAGFYAAFVRKYMFENKRPSHAFAFATGAIMEVIHMTVLFLTHLGEPVECLRIVKICTIPMIVCNGLSVMLSTVLVAVLSNEIHKRKLFSLKERTIAQKIQNGLLLCVIVAFAATTVFVYTLQLSSSKNNTKKILKNNLDDVQNTVANASDTELLRIAENMVYLIEHSEQTDLAEKASEFGVTEIHVVSSSGLIVDSSVTKYVNNVNINDCGELVRNFNVLLNGEKRYISDFGAVDFLGDSGNSGLLKTSVNRKFAGSVLQDGGFVMVGISEIDIQDILRATALNLTENRRVGESGYVVIADYRGDICSDFKGHTGKTLNEIGIDINSLGEEFKMFTNEVYETESKCMYTFAEGFYIIAVVSFSEVYDSMDVNIYINSYMEIIVFAVLFVLIFNLIKKIVVNDIYKVNTSLGNIVAGNLNETVDARKTVELSKLSDDINLTVDYLKKYISEAEQRIDKELFYAKTIQHSVMPSTFPAFPNIKNFDIFATMDTAKEVGGDFYDFYMLDDSRLAFLIADVSGKGIPAAMFMMTAKTMIKNLAETGLEPNDVFTEANKRLCENNEAGMFVTAWMGVLNIKTGHLKYTNAGHNPPVFYTKDGGFRYFKCKPGFILAGMDCVAYKLGEADLEPGDRIFLYTDGVTEATDSAEQLYGEERLLELLNSHTELDADNMLKAVKSGIDEFVGEAEQFDDITMLMVDYNGPCDCEESGD